MSNEVATTGGLVVPARYRNKPVEQLGQGISSGFPIIRLKGKEWSLSIGKDEEYDVEGKSIDVVILRDPAINARTFYEGGWQGAASKGRQPTCWSLDGKKPAEESAKISPVCDTCPKNQTYTNDKGMKVRDCANGRRLAVLPWISWTTPLLGKPLLRPCLLRVPGASLQALKAYGDLVGRQGFPYFALVTTISFEKKAEFPKLTFTVNTTIQLDDDSLDIIDQLREGTDVFYITGEKSSGMRTIDPDAEEEVEVEQVEKPKAVSLAQAMAAAKAEKEEKVHEGEVLPPEKPNKVKVTHNGKAPESKVVEAQAEAVEATAESPADEDGDEVLRNEVMKLVGA